MCPYFGHENTLENQFTLDNAFTYPRWLGAVLCQMFIVVTIETFDFGEVPASPF